MTVDGLGAQRHAQALVCVSYRGMVDARVNPRFTRHARGETGRSGDTMLGIDVGCTPLCFTCNVTATARLALPHGLTGSIALYFTCNKGL